MWKCSTMIHRCNGVFSVLFNRAFIFYDQFWKLKRFVFRGQTICSKKLHCCNSIEWSFLYEINSIIPTFNKETSKVSTQAARNTNIILKPYYITWNCYMKGVGFSFTSLTFSSISLWENLKKNDSINKEYQIPQKKTIHY